MLPGVTARWICVHLVHFALTSHVSAWAQDIALHSDGILEEQLTVVPNTRLTSSAWRVKYASALQCYAQCQRETQCRAAQYDKSSRRCELFTQHLPEDTANNETDWRIFSKVFDLPHILHFSELSSAAHFRSLIYFPFIFLYCFFLHPF